MVINNPIVSLSLVCLIFFGHTILSFAQIKHHSTSGRESKRNIKVVAHRANNGEEKYPENSITMIQSCLDQGLQILELDIRQTKDKQLVILHDKTVDRTTNGKGNIADLTLQELQQLNLKHEGKITRMKVPTLEEVLKLTKGKVMLDLDIKIEGEDSYRRIVDLVKKYDMNENVLFFLYDVADIPTLHKLAPNAQILARVRNSEEINLVQQYPFIRYIHIDEECYADATMKSLIDKGYEVWLNSLGYYDRLQKSNGTGFEQFLKKYPHITIIQTDLGLELIRYLNR